MKRDVSINTRENTSCNKRCAFNLTSLIQNWKTLQNCLRRCIICCWELKHISSFMGQLYTALQQTPNYSIFSNWGEKNSTPNIKDAISLFKDTWRLLLSSHKHAASQNQIESSSILTEAACGAEKETCSILSTLTPNTKRVLDRLLQDGEIRGCVTESLGCWMWIISGRILTMKHVAAKRSDCTGKCNLLHEWLRWNVSMGRRICVWEYINITDQLLFRSIFSFKTDIPIAN